MDPARLPAEEAIDHAVMGAQLNFIIHQLEDLRYHERSVDTYVAEPFRGVDWQIQQMTDAGNGLLGTQDEWALVIRRLNAVPAYVAAAQANLRAGKASGNLPDWRMVERDGVGRQPQQRRVLPRDAPRPGRALPGLAPLRAAALRQPRTAAGRAADAYAGFAALLERRTRATARTATPPASASTSGGCATTCASPRGAAELFAYGQQQTDLYQGLIYQVAEQVAREAGLDPALWHARREERGRSRRDGAPGQRLAGQRRRAAAVVRGRRQARGGVRACERSCSTSRRSTGWTCIPRRPCCAAPSTRRTTRRRRSSSPASAASTCRPRATTRRRCGSTTARPSPTRPSTRGSRGTTGTTSS